MRLLVIADIDDFHWQGGSGQADVLLSCGDVVDQVILEAAEAFSCQKIFAVKGNHDTHESFISPIIDLHLATEVFNGLSFGGLNGSWKYKPRGHFLYEQWEVNEILRSMPNVDIFISHNSPRHIHDQEDNVHYGFDGLNSYIIRAKPRFMIHGHQHKNLETDVSTSKIIGVFGYKLISF